MVVQQRDKAQKCVCVCVCVRVCVCVCERERPDDPHSELPTNPLRSTEAGTACKKQIETAMCNYSVIRHEQPCWDPPTTRCCYGNGPQYLPSACASPAQCNLTRNLPPGTFHSTEEPLIWTSSGGQNKTQSSSCRNQTASGPKTEKVLRRYPVLVPSCSSRDLPFQSQRQSQVPDLLWDLGRELLASPQVTPAA